MSRRYAIAALALASAATLLPRPAPAALLGRNLDGVPGTFEAYYDDVLDVTWLADANLARTESFGVAGITTDGGMSFAVAEAWLAALNSSAYLGFDDWRLPQVEPIDGVAFQYVNRADGTTDVGYSITAPGTPFAGSPGNEMAHLFYGTLGNSGAHAGALYTPTGCYVAPTFCLTNPGPFAFGDIGVPGALIYWSGTPVTDPAYAGRIHTFYFDSGFQGIDPSDVGNQWAWPVRDGDVLPVPEPASALLLAAGVGAIAAARRRRPGSGVAALAAALAIAFGGAPAEAAEKCKAKIDKKTGVIEFTASKVDAATLRWGPTSTYAVYAFYDESCLKGDKAKSCTLADPESFEAKLPPPSCTIWAVDAVIGCSAWITGCIPGLREIDLSGGAIGSEQISDGSVGSADLAPYAVGAAQIQNGAVGPVQLAAASVGASQLAPGSVQSGAIAPGAVGTLQLAPAAVGANQLAPNSVNDFHIATDGVGAAEIAAGAVGAAELADGAVGMAELDTPADNAGSGVQSLTLEAGENFLYGNAATFTPSASGRCLVVTTAGVTTVDGINDDDAYLRTAREQDGQSSHDGLEGPFFPRIPDGSRGTLTTSAIWDVTAGQPTRFGCTVFVRETDFEGDTLRCRTSYFCQ